MSSCLRDVFTDKIIHRLSGGSEKINAHSMMQSFNNTEYVINGGNQME